MKHVNAANGLAKTLQEILPCRNLMTFKLRCLSVLIPALLVDVAIRLRIDWPTVYLQTTAPGLELGLCILLAFLFCVIVDAMLEVRRQRRLDRLQVLLSSPEVPKDIREEIAKALFS